MELATLLNNIAVREAVGSVSVDIAGLTYDSRSVRAGDCFFAVRGTQCDGHTFIGAAVGAGVAAVVCEELPAERAEHVAYVVVDDAQA
ncbi:MAG: UDP-N-acetylmuramoyl-L-alanyl-D-glutamate--2,6-diaminopimelate ligase, partial [Alistipes sp.]|nr:UDP-N-acetylmuramoyl-L-alanyl-D-glutamate--2,6-diaminopimelate ligase [Alistipes sp.]